MYAWGGSTSDWRGKATYDFGSARARYDKIAASVKGPRTYALRREPDMALVDPKGKVITTESENPIVIAVDVTGSMATWPGEIFDRLPLLYQTLAKYRPDTEICFAAIGDATCDEFPLQVNAFAKGNDLEAKLKALGCEGGGGGHITESYELFGYFMLEHCKTPKAKSPFLLMYGDETFYDKIDQRQVNHYIGDTMQNSLASRDMWKSLLQKFNVYFMQKPYGDGDSGVTKEVRDIWTGAFGAQRIIQLPSYERAVDSGIGLIAKLWGEYEDFNKSIDARHDDPAVKASVRMSLRHIADSPAPVSVMSKKGAVLTKTLAP